MAYGPGGENRSSTRLSGKGWYGVWNRRTTTSWRGSVSTSSLLTQERLLVDPDVRTEPLREELAGYTWSEKLADRPVKADDPRLRRAALRGDASLR